MSLIQTHTNVYLFSREPISQIKTKLSDIVVKVTVTSFEDFCHVLRYIADTHQEASTKYRKVWILMTAGKHTYSGLLTALTVLFRNHIH